MRQRVRERISIKKWRRTSKGTRLSAGLRERERERERERDLSLLGPSRHNFSISPEGAGGMVRVGLWG